MDTLFIVAILFLSMDFKYMIMVSDSHPFSHNTYICNTAHKYAMNDSSNYHFCTNPMCRSKIQNKVSSIIINRHPCNVV